MNDDLSRHQCADAEEVPDGTQEGMYRGLLLVPLGLGDVNRTTCTYKVQSTIDDEVENKERVSL